MNKKIIQPLFAIIFFGVILLITNEEYISSLITGIILGIVVTKSRFGFSAGFRNMFDSRDGGAAKSLLLLLGMTTFLFMITNYFYTPTRLLSLNNINILSIIGAIIFGIGMVLAKGCGTGTYTDFGEGTTKALFTILFLLIGVIPGTLIRVYFQKTFVDYSIVWYLPDTFGIVGSFILTILALFIIYLIIRKYEINSSSYKYDIFEEKIKSKGIQGIYRKIIVEEWSYIKGVIIISFITGFIYYYYHTHWGAYAGLVLFDISIFNNFGLKPKDMVGIRSDAIVIRNMGIVSGSFIITLLANKFKIVRASMREIYQYSFGGLLLGLGSGLAQGCNVGGMYIAIANFSASGWIFLFISTISGLLFMKFLKMKHK